MKRLPALMLCLCLAASCLSGCGKKAEEAYVPTGDAILLEGQDPEDLIQEEEYDPVTLVYNPEMSMNPLIGYSQNNRVLFSLIYQGLFAADSKSQTYPMLCSHYKVSSDNKVFTVYIETGARFSDGTALTAQDVLATYQAAKESDYYGGRFTHVLAMDLSGSDSITFQLETPYENFALMLDIPIVKASEVDDSRPTVVRVMNDEPKLVSVLSGKINTVYDLDEVLEL